jgi:GNAT superfamily N-acetyltransferase
MALEAARGAVLAGHFDLVILRLRQAIPAGTSDGVEVIDAGCAVTYEGDVRLSEAAVQLKDTSARLRLIEAWGTRESALVEEIFAGYRNHIAANPRLDPSLVPAGYADWSARHTDGRVPGDCYVLEDEAGLPLAFAAVAPAQDALIIDLAGVLPAHRRMGVYQRLLDLIEVEAAVRGLARVRISTQQGNGDAIRAWERRGWRATEKEWTAHVMRGRDGRI